MVIRKTIGLIIILSMLFVSNLFAQTPPARTWYYNDNGVKTEVKERWDEDADGFKHGKYILYGITWIGNIYYVEEVGNFNHGKGEGIWKNFRPNGSIISIGSYKNESKVGYWKENEKDGMYQEGNYINGVRDGEWKNTFYYKNFGYNMLGREEWQEKIETKLSYKTIYKNGEVIAAYDDKGLNLFEIGQQEVKAKDEEYANQSFNNCICKDDFKSFIAIFTNSSNVLNAQKAIEVTNNMINNPSIENLKVYEELIIKKHLSNDVLSRNENLYNNSKRLSELLTWFASTSKEFVQINFEFVSLGDYQKGMCDDYARASFILLNQILNNNGFALPEAKKINIKGRKEYLQVTTSGDGPDYTLFHFFGEQYYSLRTNFGNHQQAYSLYKINQIDTLICTCNYKYTGDKDSFLDEISNDNKDLNKGFCMLRLYTYFDYVPSDKNAQMLINMFYLQSDSGKKKYIIDNLNNKLKLEKVGYQIRVGQNYYGSENYNIVLAYYYWLDGQNEQSINQFRRIFNESNIDYNYIKDFHSAYIVSIFPNGFPNEKEFFKSIKALQ